MRLVPLSKDNRPFQECVLQDLDAFEMLLKEGQVIGSNGGHVGVEQELQFINCDFEPACVGDEVINNLGGPPFTEEYARFNFEIALPPEPYDSQIFITLDRELRRCLEEINKAAKKYEARSILCSILPSLRQEHIHPYVLTQSPRYQRLHALRSQSKKDGEYEYQFHGLDDLVLRDADSVLGGVFTSLQLHWQLSPATAANEYNWSQLIAAPCLAAACCSPLFFGKRLWHETRISLFEQASDIRRRHLDSFSNEPARASFGDSWIEDISDIWRQDLAAHRPALEPETLKTPADQSQPLELANLQFFNSTVYRWNRLCYGIGPGDGPSIRVESRALPAGLSIRDELANAALWWGLMAAGAEHGADLARRIPFSRVKENFRRAARDGMECQLTWLEGEPRSVRRILLEDLIPLAAKKLREVGVDKPEWRLRPIAARARTGQTASRWMLDSFEHLREDYDTRKSCCLLTQAMAELGDEDLPVADWPPLRTAPARYGRHRRQEKSDRMPLRPDDSLSLAEHRFAWEETDELIALADDGERRVLRRAHVEAARANNGEIVSHALAAGFHDETPERTDMPDAANSVMAFGESIPLNRIVGRKDSGRPGPLLVIVAGMHGNELNALAALNAFMKTCEPQEGAVVGVLGNLPALREGRRFCSEDLNRIFGRSAGRDSPEAREASAVIQILDDLAREAGQDRRLLLDLHGTSGHSPPYVSALTDLEAWPLSENLPAPHVTGFENMFSGTLVEHAALNGWASAACELGCLTEPTTVDSGVQLLSLIAHHWGVSLLESEERRRFVDALRARCPTTETYSFVYRHEVRPADRFQMLPGFVSFQRVRKGERIATDANGDVKAPCNGRLLMPLYQEQGDDGFFIVN